MTDVHQVTWSWFLLWHKFPLISPYNKTRVIWVKFKYINETNKYIWIDQKKKKKVSSDQVKNLLESSLAVLTLIPHPAVVTHAAPVDTPPWKTAFITGPERRRSPAVEHQMKQNQRSNVCSPHPRWWPAPCGQRLPPGSIHDNDDGSALCLRHAADPWEMIGGHQRRDDGVRSGSPTCNLRG